MSVMRQFLLPTHQPIRALRYAPAPCWLGLVGSMVVMVVGFLGWTPAAQAQIVPPVEVTELITTPQANTPLNFPTSPFADPCDPISFPTCDVPGTTTNLTFGSGDDVVLNAVIAAGDRFEPASDLLPPAGLPERIEFRRAGTAPGGLANRQILFYASNTATVANINLNPASVDSIEAAMLSSTINRGIDNVFNNNEFGGSEETRNNIERVDYIIGNPGVQISDSEVGNVGFLILERTPEGGNSDPFGIAAITALDPVTEEPTAYGPMIPVTPATWGGSTNIGVNFASVVLRRDTLAVVPPTEPTFRPSHLVGSQNIRGLFFPINSLLDAPQRTQPFFGYSLFATDVNGVGGELIDFTNTAVFPADTNGSTEGGLDLIAGGFGLIRRVEIAPTGSLSLVKRITNLFGPANLPNFDQFVGDGAALALLQNNNLGQGLDVITDPTVQAGDGIEYTVYLANSSTGTAANTVVCDQIPPGLTFDPNGFGPGIGIQAIAASVPPGPLITFTNADDGDAGRFIAPGAALPSFCGTNQGNGAVVVNVGDVAANQVGLIRFRTTVN